MNTPPLERLDEFDSAPPELAPEDLDALDAAPDVVPADRVRVDDRPEVRVTLETHTVVDSSIAALSGINAGELRYEHPAGGDPNLYQRANELVTVVAVEEEPTEDERAPIARETPIIKPLSASTLHERLTKYTRFVKFCKPSKYEKSVAAMARSQGKPVPEPDTWEPCAPPPIVVNALLERGAWQGVRVLSGISETPFMRPDGTICQAPGFDAATRTLYRPSICYPAIAEEPTQKDAEGALLDLAHVFADFPYADPAHAAVPIAALLTLLARPALTNASIPAFVFDAATRGSGKTLQCDVVSLEATGRFAARKGYPEKEEEVEKVVASYCVAGTRCILFDNIKRELGGATLEAAVTARGDIELRVLGQTELRRLPWTATIFASGNNIFMSEDFARRCLVARLESPLENPEDRTNFKIPNLPAYVLENRAHLVACALTILRAYHVAGRPSMQTSHWGSFEEWAALVPPAIAFAGGGDVTKARVAQDAMLPDTLRALAVVLEELPRLDVDGKGVTVKDLVSLLFDKDNDGPPDGFEAMRDALMVWSAKRDVKEIGMVLRRYMGRVIGSHRLVRHEDKARKVARWRSERVGT